MFGDDVALVDRVACRLMGLDPCSVPLVREAFGITEFPISVAAQRDTTVVLNGEEVAEGTLRPVLGRSFIMPRGWHLPRETGT